MSLYVTEEEYRFSKANLEFSEKKEKLIANIKIIKDQYNCLAQGTANGLIADLLLNYINDPDIFIAVGEYKIENKR
jgi:hypothetical protein